MISKKRFIVIGFALSIVLNLVLFVFASVQRAANAAVGEEMVRLRTDAETSRQEAMNLQRLAAESSEIAARANRECREIVKDFGKITVDGSL